MLVVAVTVISVGPGTFGELVSGVRYARPPAASVAAPTTHLDPELQRRLQLAGVLDYGRLSAAIVDLDSGASAAIEPDQPAPAASLFKLPILVQVLAEEDAGRLDPQRQLEIRADDWTDGSGVLQARVGDRLTVRELTRLMIQESDNIAALVLLDAVGVPAVNALLDRLGLYQTRVVDRRAGEAGEHTTSAADMVRLLTLLAAGQVGSPRVSEAALAELERRQHVNWLGDSLPFWVKVAHKWGDLPGARNDVGIVYSPRASFALAVLTQEAPADEAALAIGRLSRTAYDYLGSRR